MATLDTTREGSSGDLAYEHFMAAIEADLAGDDRYPDGAAFVAADAPDLGNTLARYAREGRTVVLVYGDGEERIIKVHRPAAILTAEAAGALAASLMRGARRARRALAKRAAA